MTDTSTLPALDGDFDVPADAIEQFQRDGHACLRGVCSRDEIEVYRPLIHDAAMHDNRETRPLEERTTYGKAFLQITNLWQRHETVKRFVFARRFAKIAADLLGVDGVRLYHDQALFKEGGGGRTPWHQDQFYWPLDTNKTITMWMPLVDIPPEIGSMCFASGSQKLGYLGDHPISDEGEAALQAMLADKNLPIDTHGVLVAGDTTWHAGWVLHGAPPNPTGTLRAVMTLIYFADGTRVSEPKSPAQQFDLQQWLPGLQPGDLAASEKNPLLFAR
jgi:ectoine hydroxylase-related dioxygenase (phytanoyl-CoA dioxygenase family)